MRTVPTRPSLERHSRLRGAWVGPLGHHDDCGYRNVPPRFRTREPRLARCDHPRVHLLRAWGLPDLLVPYRGKAIWRKGRERAGTRWRESVEVPCGHPGLRACGFWPLANRIFSSPSNPRGRCYRGPCWGPHYWPGAPHCRCSACSASGREGPSSTVLKLILPPRQLPPTTCEPTASTLVHVENLRLRLDSKVASYKLTQSGALFERMKRSRKSTAKRYLTLMSTGGRDWKLWELVALIVLVGIVVGVLVFSLM